MRMNGTRTREILLPLSTADEDKRKSKLRNIDLENKSKMKNFGIGNLSSSQRHSVSTSSNLTRRSTLPKQRFIEISVVDSIPTLNVSGTNLSHNALMLYSGELTMLKLTLENRSDVDVDFVDLKFSDNSTEKILNILEENQINAIENYDLEYKLKHEPVFRPCSDISKIKIPAQNKFTIDIECFGRLGCSQGIIFIEYGKCNKNDDGQTYVRQLTYPILLTIQQTLECQQISCLNFKNDLNQNKRPEYPTLGLWGPESLPTTPISPILSTPIYDQNKFIRLQSIENDNDHFLMVVDVKNYYNQPFEIVMERIDKDIGICRLVQPGFTARVAITIRKLKLSNNSSKNEIPTEIDRQFTVSQASLPIDIERNQRELFWYSEELYNQIRCYWREPKNNDRTRLGSFNLRKFKLNNEMLKIVKRDALDVSLNIENESMKLSKFSKFKVKIKNKSERKLNLKYRLMLNKPNNKNKSEDEELYKILIIQGPKWNYLNDLNDEDTYEHSINILPISKCNFEVKVYIEEIIDNDEPFNADDDWNNKVKKSIDRICNYISTPCIIEVNE